MRRYLNVYTKYEDLLDYTAEQSIAAFLREKHEIDDFVAVGGAPGFLCLGDLYCDTPPLPRCVHCAGPDGGQGRSCQAPGPPGN